MCEECDVNVCSIYLSACVDVYVCMYICGVACECMLGTSVCQCSKKCLVGVASYSDQRYHEEYQKIRHTLPKAQPLSDSMFMPHKHSMTI